eukprot:TRINITY_DN25575_c0_g1_i1.p2 TRINITY_DN25575_c0_g1~~TRINITY_DN25575_c0_g1_i1.p2  ORF type:complete len:121 (-),score=20.36 TRINITY_DN25575_c0_g1_i1:250-561(-)
MCIRDRIYCYFIELAIIPSSFDRRFANNKLDDIANNMKNDVTCNNDDNLPRLPECGNTRNIGFVQQCHRCIDSDHQTLRCGSLNVLKFGRIGSKNENERNGYC